MFLEKRKVGKTIKHYLVHSYRDKNGTVQKVRRYLGANLSDKQLNRIRPRAEELILEQVKEVQTDVFDFSLSPTELAKLNKYSSLIEVHHLNKKEWQKFTQEFVYNTNAIEGSTVLRDDVSKVLRKSQISHPEEHETKGVAEAINYIKTAKGNVSKRLLLKLHKLCFAKTKTFAGQFRAVNVVIRDRIGKVIHQGVLVENLDQALDDLVLWYKKNKKMFTPLVLAAIMHNQFEHIHPFQDGNGRVGRLLLNYVLLQHNYPPINILLEDRAEYYATLQAYHHDHDLLPTMKFLIKQYKKTLKQVTTE